MPGNASKKTMRSVRLAAAASVCIAASAPLRAAATDTRVSDVFAGQNKPGPYALAWKNISPDAVVAVVDGVTLAPEAYTLDAGKGTVTFKATLKPQSVARVDYGFDPAKAQRNPNPATSPVTVSLLERQGAFGDARLQVTALPGAVGGSDPLMVWGLSGKTLLFGGGLQSQLYVSPDAPGGGSAFVDRAGIRLGYGVGDDHLRANFSLERSGRGFAPTAGKSFGLAEAAQRWSAGMAAKPAAWLAAEFKWGEARDLSGTGSSGQSALSVRLFGTGRAPLLQVSRTEDTRFTGDGAAASVTTEAVQASGKLGGTGTFAAQGQRVTNDGPAPGTDQVKQDASLSVATGTKDTRVQASASLSESATQNENGVESRQTVEVKARLQPSAKLSVSAEARQQAVTPAHGEKDAGQQTWNGAASIELKPLANTRVVGTLKTQGDRDNQASVTELNAETRLLRYLTVSGGLTDRDDTRQALDDTTRLRMVLRPLAGWQLTGGLTINPETNGSVADATRQEWALAARLGAMELTGGYSLTSAFQALDASQSGELSLQVGLRFSRFTRMTGGYKDSFVYGAADARGARSYSLGLNHDVGSAFNFSLSGSLNEDKTVVAGPADLKAEAKVGLKF